MAISPFVKTMLKATQEDNYQSADKRVVITHGTSAANLSLSLSEYEAGVGHKPAMSAALTTIPILGENATELERSAVSKSLTKFGEIVIALNPESAYKNDMTILTRDAYTVDAPKKVAVSFSDAGMMDLENRIEPYLDLTKSQVIRNLKLDSTHPQSRGVDIPVRDIAMKLGDDIAFQLLFVKEKGIEFELPYVPSAKPTELTEFFSKTLPAELLTVTALTNPSQEAQQAIIDSYNDYYQAKLDGARNRFRKNMYSSFLSYPDSEKLSDGLGELLGWVEQIETNKMELDVYALGQGLREIAYETHTALFDHYKLQEANKIVGEAVYSVTDDLSFDSKVEAWEYINENSDAQSQQSLTYSENKVFSLKAKEIQPDEIYDNLHLLNPMMFAQSDDALGQGNSETPRPLVNEFYKDFERLREVLRVTENVSSYAERRLAELVLLPETSMRDLTEISPKLNEDSVLQASELLNSVKDTVASLSEGDMEFINFNNAYHEVRGLRNDLSHLIGVSKMSFSEGREFYCEVMPHLCSHPSGDARNFDADLIIDTMIEFHGDEEKLEQNRETIEVITEALGDAFYNLPEGSPYFELVTNNAFDLNSSAVHSIHVPDTHLDYIAEVYKDHPELESKVVIYDSAAPDGLSLSVINSGAAVEPDYFSPDARASVELTSKRSTKLTI